MKKKEWADMMQAFNSETNDNYAKENQAVTEEKDKEEEFRKTSSYSGFWHGFDEEKRVGKAEYRVTKDEKESNTYESRSFFSDMMQIVSSVDEIDDDEEDVTVSINKE